MRDEPVKDQGKIMLRVVHPTNYLGSTPVARGSRHSDSARGSHRSQNPLRLLLRAALLWLRRRVHFVVDDLADVHLEDRGESFTAFRKVVAVPASGRNEPGAVFRVRFTFKNLSPRANRRLSLIPIPFIVAQPGFRSKTWLLGERSGDFIGLYEFDSVESAEAYWCSLPLRMMRRRAAPGSLDHEVLAIPGGAPERDPSLCVEVVR